MLDFDAINDRALSDYGQMLKTWFPQGRRNGDEFLIGDLSGKRGESMSINVKTGVWCDFAGSGKGGDPISLWAAIKRVDRVEAARQLGAMLGVSEVGAAPAAREKKEQRKDEPLQYPPENAQPPRVVALKNENDKWVEHEVVASWPYKDKDGKLVSYVCRVHTGRDENGKPKKETIPHLWIDGKWKQRSLPKPRLLYRIDELFQRPSDPVAIGEGEKTADALRVFLPGYVCLSWPGGTKAVDLADWSVISGRKVIIFPDADEVGLTAAKRIVEILMLQGCQVKLVDMSGMPDGWDAADAMRDDWTNTQFIEWAKPRMKEVRSPDSQGDMPLPSSNDIVEYDEQPYTPPSEEGGAERVEPTDNRDQPHFRFLGVVGSEFFFYVYRTGQIVSYSGPSLEKKGNLYTLAPEYFWTQQFGAKKEAAAMNALIRQSEQVGLFNPSRIRGLGAWEDNGRSVLHLGNRLLVDGKETPVQNFITKYVYEQQHQLDINTDEKPLSNRDALKLVDICESLRWADRISGKLLAGWIFASIVCGAVSWRSHIYIIGPAGSGKSWVVDNIIGRILEGMALKVQSKTTESGIRQALGADARPIIFDEAETDSGQQEQVRMQGVFDLARQASSGGAPIVKGSAGQKKNEYHVRSCFCFASINPSITQYADETRITILRLRPPAVSGSREWEGERKNFVKIQNDVFETITEAFRAGLFARAVWLLPVIKYNQKVFASVGGKYFGGQRQADQMSMMLAGLYALYSGNKISPTEASDWIQKQAWGEIKSEEIESTETRLLSVFMQKKLDTVVGSQRTEITVGEMIDRYRKNPMDGEKYHDVLKRYGIKINTRECVAYISNTAEGMKEILKGTPWGARWHKVMLNIPNVVAAPTAQRFTPGLVTQCVIVPLHILFSEEP